MSKNLEKLVRQHPSYEHDIEQAKLQGRLDRNAELRAEERNVRLATLQEVMRAFNPVTRQLSAERFADLFPEVIK